MLSLDDNEFVSPDPLFEMLDVGVRDVVEIETGDDTAETVDIYQSVPQCCNGLLTLYRSFGPFGKGSTLKVGSGGRMPGAILSSSVLYECQWRTRGRSQERQMRPVASVKSRRGCTLWSKPIGG